MVVIKLITLISVSSQHTEHHDDIHLSVFLTISIHSVFSHLSFIPINTEYKVLRCLQAHLESWLEPKSSPVTECQFTLR